MKQKLKKHNKTESEQRNRNTKEHDSDEITNELLLFHLKPGTQINGQKSKD